MPPNVRYVDEIQTMMYAAGDCRRPLVESASIVEEIVLKQMIWFIHRSQNACESRGGQYLDAEDLLFTLRRHPVILGRVIQKLKAKDYSAQTSKSDDTDGPSVAAAEDGDEEEDKEGTTPAIGTIIEDKGGKRMKFCRKVLEKWDPKGFLLASVLDTSSDKGKTDRMRRITVYAASMDADEYVRFSEARQVSFTKSLPNSSFGRPAATPRKFRDWLFASDPFFANANFKPSQMAMEMLHILAYEVLATIMDCAFVVKQESAAAGFGSKSDSSVVKEGGEYEYAMSRVSPLIATSNSQQMALLLSQRLREKPQNRGIRFGMDRLVNEAVQPWELREAVRRLRFQHGNDSEILEEGQPSAVDRVIF